jgi:membrane protein required for colicin V production
VTVFDYAVLTIVAASILLGAWRGLVKEALSLTAWVAALLIGRALAPEIAPLMGTWFGGWLREPIMQYVAAFAVIVVAVLVAATLVQLALTSLLRAIGLGPLDRFLGTVFGVARGALVVVLCVLAGGFTALPQQTWWRQAVLAPPLETAVLAAKPWLPPAVAERIRYR